MEGGEKGGPVPDNFATIDHLRSRLSPHRTEPNLTNEERTVLACPPCNLDRAAQEEKAIPLHELWRRSGRAPQQVMQA
jgi:hypothetical protein